MAKTTIKNRFELVDKYKCVVILKDGIVLSKKFYQSDDHFLYRDKNSNSDEMVPMRNIDKFTYNNIGVSVDIFYKHEKRKLSFSNNKRMLEFLDKIKLRESFVITEQAIPNYFALATIIPIFLFALFLGYHSRFIEVASLMMAAYYLFYKVKGSIFVIYEKPSEN